MLGRGSLVVAFAVESTFYSYGGGVYQCPDNFTTAYGKINHAVELVGMECAGNYIIKNSWGTTWGNAGFATIDPNFDCGLSAYVYSILFGSYQVFTFAFAILAMIIMA